MTHFAAAALCDNVVEGTTTTGTRAIRVAFVITSMPVGGAEMLLYNLIQKLPSRAVEPMICCLKERGELGDRVAEFVPIYERLIRHKYDATVLWRLRRIFLEGAVDAVITVGAGDKMFWGRIAARWAGVPVVLSALHSTGWPDGVSRANRWLTPITDGFIGVAERHGAFLVQQERFPQHKVFVIPNGIDADRFVFSPASRAAWRNRWGIDVSAPVVGIVAALRPEKNHELFLAAARRVAARRPEARFVIVGDGPQRTLIEQQCRAFDLTSRVVIAGTQNDIPGILCAMDVFALTSHNEASPVSIMEAMSCERPVVATRVGSVEELVLPGRTGILTPPGNEEAMSAAWQSLLDDPESREKFGHTGRQLILSRHSLDAMADGYAALVRMLLVRKGVRARGWALPFPGRGAGR